MGHYLMVIFLRDTRCFLTICLSLTCLHLRYVYSCLLCTFCLTFFLTAAFHTSRDLLHVRCSAFKYFFPIMCVASLWSLLILLHSNFLVWHNHSAQLCISFVCSWDLLWKFCGFFWGGNCFYIDSYLYNS